MDSSAAAQSMRPTPALVEGGDGRLWFALSTGLGVIDPAHIVRNTLPPPVTIWSLTSEGHEYSPYSREILLPVRHSPAADRLRGLEVFAVPERVRFRYRLEGLDDTWQDVGDRREAIYTNVAPGTYRFRVIASNNDGVWNEKGATLVFTIPPAFYQTTWFYALCALFLIAVIVLLYRLRLRQATTVMRERLEDRIVERERIARDLHDTLLQGLQGLILRSPGRRRRAFPAHEPASDMMERALTRADEVLLESRARVKDLRDSLELRDDLPATLESVGQRAVAGIAWRRSAWSSKATRAQDPSDRAGRGVHDRRARRWRTPSITPMRSASKWISSSARRSCD